MKTRLAHTALLAGMLALSLAFTSALRAQSTASTPANPSGSEADSKSTSSSTAQQNNASTDTSATAASAPDKTNSKDTTDSLDKNPSTTSSDSANQSATKTPTTATTEDQRQNGKDASGRVFSDKHFMVKAAEGGMTEVELGKIAQQKGSSAEVKQFGAHMVADHSKANDDLKNLAQQKGITIPTKLDARHQAMVDKLSKLSGRAFDRAYVNDMVEDHQKTAADFQKASTSAQDPDVKAFASQTLTVIQGHLADIQAIQSNLK